MQFSPAESPGGARPLKIDQPPLEPANPEIVSYGVAGVALDRKLQLLSDKVDRVLEVLTLEEERRSAQQTASHVIGEKAGHEQNPGVRSGTENSIHARNGRSKTLCRR